MTAIHLDSAGLFPDESLDHETKQVNPRLATLVHGMLEELQEDPDREGLLKTPERVARSLEFLTSGHRMDLEKLVNGAIFSEECNEMVAVKRIPFYSLCEHHMLPFFGVCSVAYVPDGRIIGLSKIPRIVDMYARRLQVQERLTNQIAQALDNVLNPAGVAVVMEAHHLCMMMRGVEKQDSRTVTSAMHGVFKEDPRTRQEFLMLMGWTAMGV